MNDCKYGYSMKDRVMTQTLIKSGTEPNLTADQEAVSYTHLAEDNRNPPVL